MKRILLLIFVFVLVLSLLCACTGQDDILQNEDENEDDTTEAPETTAAPDGDEDEKEPEGFDYMSEDLTKYVTLGAYKGIEVEVADAALTDEDIENNLNALLSENVVKTQIKDRAAADGDTVNIDYVGKLDGVAFAGGTASGASLTLGSNTYIDGFEAGLVGVMPGETVELNLTFPDPYLNNPDLSGAAVVFTVTLNYIDGVEISEWNDEFVKSLTDGEYENADEFLATLKEYWADQKKSELESKKTYDILGKILDATTVIEYPEAKVTEYKAMFISEYEYYAEAYQMSLDDLLSTAGMTREEFDSYVNESVKTIIAEDLVFYSIVKAEKMEVSEEEYQSALEEYSAYYGVSVEEFLKSYDEKLIKEQVLYDKVMQFITANAVEVSAK